MLAVEEADGRLDTLVGVAAAGVEELAGAPLEPEKARWLRRWGESKLLLSLPTMKRPARPLLRHLWLGRLSTQRWRRRRRRRLALLLVMRAAEEDGAGAEGATRGVEIGMLLRSHSSSNSRLILRTLLLLLVRSHTRAEATRDEGTRAVAGVAFRLRMRQKVQGLLRKVPRCHSTRCGCENLIWGLLW